MGRILISDDEDLFLSPSYPGFFEIDPTRDATTLVDERFHVDLIKLR